MQNAQPGSGGTPKHRPRSAGPIFVLVLIAIGVPGAVLGYPWMTTRVLMHRAVQDADPAARAGALVDLGRERAHAATGVVLEALRDEEARVREAAAYALHKLQPPQAAAAVAEAVEIEPDTSYRAKMVVYLARLSGRDLLEALRTWSAGSDLWLSTGAALARVELADAAAADLLFERLAGDDTFLAAYIKDELRFTLEAMMEMIGHHVDLTTPPGKPWSADQLADIRAWWKQYEHATGKLLADIAVQKVERRGIRRQLDRLAGARRRATTYLGLD